ncbi:MAG: ribosome maturation factor RimM [Parvularculaceae bacterium]
MVEKRICLGAFAGAHGVKGEAKVKTFTEKEAGVAAYGPVASEDGGRVFTLKFIRILKPRLALVSAPEIASREDAASLTGVRFYVSRDQLPAAEDGEYYHEDLIGLAVIDETGDRHGEISALHNFGAGDIIEITRPSGARQMIAFQKDIVPIVDMKDGRVTVLREALIAGDDLKEDSGDS